MVPTVPMPLLSLTSKVTSWQPHGQPQQQSAQSNTLWLISSTGEPDASLMSNVIWQHANGSTTEPIASPVAGLLMKTSGRLKQQHVQANGRSMWMNGSGGWPMPVSSAMSMLNGRLPPSKTCLPSMPMTPWLFSAATNRSCPVTGSEHMYLFGISKPTRTSASCTFSLILMALRLASRPQGSLTPAYMTCCVGMTAAPATASGTAAACIGLYATGTCMPGP
mmetsp:Transcript_36805/g.83273  ORF Transcript_36805/g.83273 Transcript_36805/m.83273 type:complete len:221 (+) Transcript_36805:313-975(+)